MTYEEEMRLAAYKFRLDVKKSIVDKIFIGAVIALFAFLASLYHTQFESNLAKSRFLLDQRLDALVSIRAIYSKLDNTKSDLLSAPVPYQKDIKSKYDESIQAFINVSNKHSLLFSKDFARQLIYHTHYHRAIVEGRVEIEHTMENYLFTVDIGEHFEEMTRLELLSNTFNIDAETSDNIFKFPNITDADFAITNPSDFFEMTRSAWKAQQE